MKAGTEVIFTLSSCIVSFTLAITVSDLSPGNSLMLIVTFATVGTTLSFIPALKIVGTMVVRTNALPEAVFS